MDATVYRDLTAVYHVLRFIKTKQTDQSNTTEWIPQQTIIKLGGNCKCITTWGLPTSCQSSLTAFGQICTARAHKLQFSGFGSKIPTSLSDSLTPISLEKNSDFAIRRRFRVENLIFDQLTMNICRTSGVTWLLYHIWAKSNNPRLSWWWFANFRCRYVMLWPWSLTPWPWTFVVHLSGVMWSNSVPNWMEIEQSAVKLQRLKDLKFGGRPHLGFHGRCLSVSARPPQTPNAPTFQIWGKPIWSKHKSVT